MNSIVEAVFRHAEEQANAPAILFEEEVISYAQLRADVTRFADALKRAGLQAGERVALFLGNGPAFVVAYLGTHLAGGIVVLVNTQYRQVELSHILNDAGIRFCVTGPAGHHLKINHVSRADNRESRGTIEGERFRKMDKTQVAGGLCYGN